MENFTEDEKIRIWMDYVVTIIGLNTIPLDMNNRKPEDRVGEDAIISVHTQFFTFNGGQKYIIKYFDSFCNDGTLYEWYEKFGNRIFKK